MFRDELPKMSHRLVECALLGNRCHNNYPAPRRADRGTARAGHTSLAGGPEMTTGGRRTVSPRPRIPRIGLGTGRIEPDRARFRAVPELLQYLCDYRGLTQAELADRCGVRREQVSRWMNGTAEPNLARLRAAMASLGLAPVIALEPTSAALDAMRARPTDLDQLLDWNVLDLLGTVAAATAEGLDVVVGGEVAAVLQGVPLSTRGHPGGASCRGFHR